VLLNKRLIFGANYNGYSSKDSSGVPRDLWIQVQPVRINLLAMTKELSTEKMFWEQPVKI